MILNIVDLHFWTRVSTECRGCPRWLGKSALLRIASLMTAAMTIPLACSPKELPPCFGCVGAVTQPYDRNTQLLDSINNRAAPVSMLGIATSMM